MYCRNCGQEINDEAYACPYCGVKAAKEPEKKSTNVLAIVGLILAFLFPIAGLICSIIARRQCAERHEDGSGLALAGLIISIAEIVLSVLSVVLSFVLMMWGYGSLFGILGELASVSLMPAVL